VIEVDRIVKRFGATRALDGVSFTVGKGEIVGFLGANGAGKTTTLRIVTGYLVPDEGSARVCGIDVAGDPPAAQARLGYLPEHAPLPVDVRVADYLSFRGRLKGIARRELGARIDRAIDRMRLGDVRRRTIGELSKGYRQRVGLADAILAEPEVLVLDEPTAGLDPAQLAETRELLAELGRDRALLLSSHDLRQVEALATRVVILRGGRVAADRPTSELRGGGEGPAFVVVVAPSDVEAARAALGEEAVVVTDAAAGRLRVTLPSDEIARRLVGARCALRELRPDERRLEDVIVEATR
jgi:ABC-2 type transport system ATP-binding protein